MSATTPIPHVPIPGPFEPLLRRLEVEFAGQVSLTYVMGGLHREPLARSRPRAWLEAGARSGMPVDARLWAEGGPKSSYPACIAVVAASEQENPGAYLRRLREGFAVRRRKLEVGEALVAEAREMEGPHRP